MKKSNIYSLVIIIILLIIVVPLTIFGYIYKENNKVEENPDHKFFYEGKLWFYDANDNLINSYECQTKICEYAKSDNSSDEEYNINYYKDGKEEYIPIILDTYAFIKDGDYINLYDLKHGKTIQNYLTVKNYNTDLLNDIYILENKDNLWGVLSISEVINMNIPFEYEFVGIKNELDNDILNISKYIVKKDDKWSLINNNNEVLTSLFENTIIDYNDNYIITYKDNYNFYDYQKTKYFNNIEINKYIFEDKYIGIIYNNSIYIYTKLGDNYVKQVPLNSTDNISLKYLDNVLYIYENNTLLDTYNS